MHICVDVGNTTIRVGFFEDNLLINRIILSTDLNKTIDQYYDSFLNLFKTNNIDVSKIDKGIYSSVVPSLNITIKLAIKKLLKIDLLVIGPGIKTGVMMKVDNPYEVGTDLVADLVGTYTKYGYPSLIIDLGTATKMLLIDKSGAFSSALIMPGINLSVDSLSSKTALLPEVSLEHYKDLKDCKNTIDAMSSGIIYGHYFSIIGLVNKYEEELGYKCNKIITGGALNYIKDLLSEDYIIDEELVIYGLEAILIKNDGGK